MRNKKMKLPALTRGVSGASPRQRRGLLHPCRLIPACTRVVFGGDVTNSVGGSRGAFEFRQKADPAGNQRRKRQGIVAHGIHKTEEKWRSELAPDEYAILREKKTEKPFSGKYVDAKEKGIYACKACGNRLFSSDTKFDSGTGWPSFDKTLPGAVEYVSDETHGMKRTEVVCAKCGSHLGHVFDDGPTKTGKRYCVNSLSLSLTREKE